MEIYGCSQAKTFEEQAANAPSVQQRPDAATAQQLSPMRGSLSSPSRVPGLRLL